MSPLVNADEAIKPVPWTAYLLIQIRSQAKLVNRSCTANLITNEHVLTAGHCYCVQGVQSCTIAEKVIMFLCFLCPISVMHLEKLPPTTRKKKKIAFFLRRICAEK